MIIYDNNIEEIMASLCILAMDHRKSCLSCVFWQWIIGRYAELSELGDLPAQVPFPYQTMTGIKGILPYDL